MEAPSSHPMRTFIVVWLGQLASLVGSGMTAFALGLWVLERTGSTTHFTLISFFGVLPAIVGLPVAGVLVDRWGGRRAMIVADLGEGACVLTVAALAHAGVLAVWEIYAAASIGAGFSALRRAAYSTLPSMLLRTQDLARANGLVHASEAATMIIAPLVAGFLVTWIELAGVMVIDVLTFVIALASLALVRGIRARRTDGARAEAGGIGYGWRYIRERPGLLLLLGFFVVTNFTVQGLGRALFTPLVLTFSSKEVLGTLLSIGGVGLLAGAAAMSMWGGPKRHINGVLGFTLVQSAFIVIAALRPSVVLCGIAIFALSFCFPIVMGSSQALWQRKVPLRSQGRVFSIRYMIGWSSFPLAYLVGGFLVDRVFEPLLADRGALASSVGRLIGVGPGRGIAFLYLLLGAITAAVAIIGYRFDRLRLVQEELQDTLAE